MTKIIAISDTHNQHHKIHIPKCDILIHCGDATMKGSLTEIKSFFFWLEKQPAKHIVYVAGNHDVLCEENKNFLHMLLHEHNRINYLEDSSLEVENLLIYGSPWCVPTGWAFSANSVERYEHWKMIPENTNILITHTPPKDILDSSKYPGCQWLEGAGLRAKIKYHFFGHIHEGRGYLEKNNIHYYNCANLTQSYELAHKPHEIDL